ncbi:membrane-spanning 4-domains subfamily A member 4D-like isoform X1 [Aquarana catesbeiana]|uniref:membrane-spanning 4-domains subfamily A member 4D-like isoform X1 n=1 Tax=Aquarana catesbeiana TaxID=8400 RepID=UPI003CCA0D03
MTSQVNNGNQQIGIQALDQIDPPPYQCIAPSEYPIYSSNVPPANPAWNIYNAAPQPITVTNPQQWNIHPAATLPSMVRSQNVLPGTVMPQNRDLTLFQEAFLKGKPKVMGSALVALAFLQAGIGYCLFYTIANFTWKSYIPFWGLVVYIMTGVVTIRSKKNVQIHLVKYSLAFSILTTLISLAAIILICIDYTHTECYHTEIYYEYQQCLLMRTSSLVVLSVLLLLNLTLCCVAITVSAFSCRALCHLNTNVPQVFILHNGTLYPMPPGTVPPAPPSFSPSDLPPPY